MASVLLPARPAIILAVVVLAVEFGNLKFGGLEVVVAGGSGRVTAEKQIQPANPATTTRARKKAQEPLPLLVGVALQGQGSETTELVRFFVRVRLRLKRSPDRFFIPWHKLM